MRREREGRRMKTEGTYPTYRLESIGDFLKVPKDRLAACLSEFRDFLDVTRDVIGLADTLGEITGSGYVGARVGAFTWIDDGKKEQTIRVTVRGEE